MTITQPAEKAGELPRPETKAGAADPLRPETKAGVVDLLERSGSVVVPVAVALYALLYLGIQQVYGIFNISPEQAGIDQATMFGRLVGTLVLLIIGGTLLAGAFVAVVWLLDKATFGRLLRLARVVRVRPWAAASAGALWCGATYWGFLGYLGLGEGASLAGIVVTAVAIGALAFLVPFRLLRSRPAGRAGMKIVLAAFTGIGLGFALMGQMERDALAVAEEGRPASILLSMAGFQDQWVVLTDRESGKALRGGVELLLLGERGSAYALYDCARQETFRISIDSTVLRRVVLQPDRPDGYSCTRQAS